MADANSEAAIPIFQLAVVAPVMLGRDRIATPTSPSSNAKKTAGRGRDVKRNHQPNRVKKIATVATISAVNPDGRKRSAKVTPPLPPTIKQLPTIIASRQ